MRIASFIVFIIATYNSAAASAQEKITQFADSAESTSSNTLPSAQNSVPEMADLMRTDGKIYVVVLVLATIFAGIIAYLIRIERKINNLEKNN